MPAEPGDRRRTAAWAVIDTVVVVYALLPVLWILSLSLKPTSTVKDGKLIPSSPTLDNYRGIFRSNNLPVRSKRWRPNRQAPCGW